MLPQIISEMKNQIGRVRQILRDHQPNDSWYWELLRRYRDRSGRTLKEAEMAWMAHSDIFDSEAQRREFLTTNRWTLSPRPAGGPHGVNVLINLISSFFGADEEFTYLEFGMCFGTTFAQVLGHFKNACGIGVELVPERCEVARWVVNEMNQRWALNPRVDIQCSSILEARIPPGSVDVVFMDTSHKYPHDYEFVNRLVKGGHMKPKFLFIGDDPLHTGTDEARRRLIVEWSHRYKFITRSDLNLFWFFEW